VLLECACHTLAILKIPASIRYLLKVMLFAQISWDVLIENSWGQFSTRTVLNPPRCEVLSYFHQTCDHSRQSQLHSLRTPLVDTSDCEVKKTKWRELEYRSSSLPPSSSATRFCNHVDPHTLSPPQLHLPGTPSFLHVQMHSSDDIFTGVYCIRTSMALIDQLN